MIEIDGKDYRNLIEQVEYLSDKMYALIKQLPYNGPYDTLDDIPDDVLVDNGTYLVGTDSYTIYKYDESTDDFISLGYFGAKGDKGDTGATGAIGAAGEKGDTGATGTAAGFGTPVLNITTVAAVEPASGTIVASGDDTEKVFTFNLNLPRGLDGTEGPAGPKGDKGDQGIMGPTGPKGEVGATGATGAAAGFGTPRTHVTTVGPTAEASVAIETAGPDTAKVFTFNFEIPQGPQGIQGIQGIPGKDGADGERGPRGIQGPKGDTGAAIVSTVLTGQDAQGGNIYTQTFDNASTATFTAPKGDQGIQGIQGNPNVIQIGSTTYSGTTINLPTTTLTFVDSNNNSTTAIIVLGSSN